MNLSPDQLDEIDRNARAFGWEVGRGHPLTEVIEECSPDNPFLKKNWRSVIPTPLPSSPRPNVS